MRLLLIGVTAAVLLGVVLGPGRGQDSGPVPAQKPEAKKVQELMRRKLVGAQGVLEALAVNDLDRAAKHAEELLRVRKEAAWKVHRTERYELFSDQFAESAEGLLKAAREKNLEAAKLHYLGMTMSCFNCHSYTRDLKKSF